MEYGPIRAVTRDGIELAPEHAVAEILIVDDHPLMCDALAATLGYSFGLRKVRVASSIAAAVSDLRDQGLPDAVVLDLNLPDTDGVEGVLAIRKLIGDVPLAVISAEVEPELVSAAMGAGASGYVGKLPAAARMVEAFSRDLGGRGVLPDGARRRAPTAARRRRWPAASPR
ncbi:MAG: response regulator transcription factor [Amaricoccus sp.]